MIDCDGVIIDGSLSPDLIRTLALRIDSQLDDMNLVGLIRPMIVPGSIDADARALGGAILPLYSTFAPDRDVLLNTA